MAVTATPNPTAGEVLGGPQICPCMAYQQDENEGDTLERVAKWLEGKALEMRGSEIWDVPTFLRSLARDIRDGRIQ